MQCGIAFSRKKQGFVCRDGSFHISIKVGTQFVPPVMMRNAEFEASNGFKNSEPPDDPRPGSVQRHTRIFTTCKIWPAFKTALTTLRPDRQRKNPALFLAEMGAALIFVFILYALSNPNGKVSVAYLVSLDIWLFLTVICANFVAALTDGV